MSHLAAILHGVTSVEGDWVRFATALAGMPDVVAPAAGHAPRRREGAAAGPAPRRGAEPRTRCGPAGSPPIAARGRRASPSNATAYTERDRRGRPPTGPAPVGPAAAGRPGRPPSHRPDLGSTVMFRTMPRSADNPDVCHSFVAAPSPATGHPADTRYALSDMQPGSPDTSPTRQHRSGRSTDPGGRTPPPSRPARSRRRAVVGWVVTAVAALLVLAVLTSPIEINAMTPAAFLRLPVEALVAVALLLVVPARARRWVAGDARRAARRGGHLEDPRPGVPLGAAAAVRPGAGLDPVRRRGELPARLDRPGRRDRRRGRRRAAGRRAAGAAGPRRAAAERPADPPPHRHRPHRRRADRGLGHLRRARRPARAGRSRSPTGTSRRWPTTGR